MKYNKAFYLVISFCGLLFFCSPEICTAKSEGRFSFGSFASTERFREGPLGAEKNDYLIASTRLFYRLWDLGEDHWEMTTDLRDNHDFYDKLDAVNLRLTDRNSFQVRQMFARWVNPEGSWSTYLGRFPFLEAGDVYVDGAEIEYRWTRNWKSAIFGGLNPQTTDQAYLHFNTNTTISGTSLTYQSKGGSWDRNLYLTHAVVSEMIDGLQDRYYFFHQMNYQWESNSRLMTVMYLDFVPKTYVQIGNLLWQQQMSLRTSFEVDLLGIDIIEYTRRQDVRETLPSSAYQEGRLRFNITPQPTTKLAIEALSGHRAFDNKTKTEASLGFAQNKIFSQYWDFYVKAGGRKNFVSDDIFARSGLGYFSNSWESTLDFEYASEKREDGRDLHPVVVDCAVSSYISKTLYLTFSLQRAADETAEILTAFFKLGYRFGSREVPAIRDGAPPRGPL